jgi:WD40 repeat protein
VTVTPPLARLTEPLNVTLIRLMSSHRRSVFRPVGRRRTPSDAVNSDAESAAPHDTETVETTAALTVSVVAPIRVSYVAVIVAWPLAKPVATPVPLIVATAACDDAKVRLWDPITGQVMLVLDGHAQRVNAVAFSPGGQTLASASHDGTIKLWHGEVP